MYPEVAAAGGLCNALAAEFRKLNSRLLPSPPSSLTNLSVSQARLEKGQKSSRIYLAADEPFYLPDFWQQGVCLADGQTAHLVDLANALDYWLCHEVTTAELAAAFAFVTPKAKAAAFDEGREVAYTWARLQADKSREELRAFVDLARHDEVLRALFPYTSLYTLCFSRCTGFPYTHDTPTVTPRGWRLFGGWRYEVNLPGNRLLGWGTAAQALALVKAYLPVDIRPAVKGTANEL